MESLISRDDKDEISTLTLNRPEKRNALSIALWGELEDHIADIEAIGDAIGVVVLAANGPTFCAGNDLSERGADTPRANYQASIVTKLANLPQPVVAAVQGGCYTGGLELVLAADIIIAADDAVFADTHGKFALVPIWGMSQRLPRRVGPWKAREMSFTGLPVSGAEAARIGLANCCVPGEKLADETHEMARAIADQSRHSVFAYKKLYAEQADLPLAEGLAHEIAESAGIGPDFAERVNRQFGK